MHEHLHASNNNYNRALRCIRVWKKRVVVREIRKKIGEVDVIAETIESVEKCLGRKKRKQEPLENQKAKDEKREETKQIFKK